MEKFEFKKIAEYRGQLKQKFAVPRQSGLVNDLKGDIIFEPEFRNESAFRGLEEISHIWLLWIFSENKQQYKFQSTVRPPRLLGDKRIGVWATRSPNRPNRIALSAVKLEEIIWNVKKGPILRVAGADLVDGTPIIDIKPYIPYADIHEDAVGGFAQTSPKDNKLEIKWEINLADYDIKEEDKHILENILALDPRPAYLNDGERVYGFKFENYEVKFKVEDNCVFVINLEYVK